MLGEQVSPRLPIYRVRPCPVLIRSNANVDSASIDTNTKLFSISLYTASKILRNSDQGLILVIISAMR